MISFRPLLVALLSLQLFLSPLLAKDKAQQSPSSKPVTTASKAPGAEVAKTLSTVTGVAISPLMGTAALGAYKYFEAEDTPEAKAALPWYAQVKFWLPALLIVGLCALKDCGGIVVPPGLKKPFDVLETLENKMSGLVAAGAVVPMTMDSLSKMIVADVHTHGPLSSGLATITMGAIDVSWALNLLMVPLGVAVFFIVWMASHTIHVLILLSPWGPVDAFLKGLRTSLIGLLAMTAAINPWLGALLSLLIIVLAYFIAGWSFRLTVFGSIFCWDFLTGKQARHDPKSAPNWVFSGSLMNNEGVPVRSYGQWRRGEGEQAGRWLFSYRPWLIGKTREVCIDPAHCELGRGFFYSSIRVEKGTWLTLSPRYRGHEDELVSLYQISGGVKPAGLRKAWSVLKELFTGHEVNRQSA